MRQNFLTIPFAPNYEISFDLVCRNKKTGRIMKPIMTNCGSVMYNLCVNGKVSQHHAKKLRTQAEAVLDEREWCPIPSTGNKYEMTRTGLVRNVKSKHLLKKNCRVYYLFINNKTVAASPATLIWEVFGEFPKKCRPRMPVTLIKDDRRIFFDNLSRAAEFLAEKYFYSVEYFRARLTRRRQKIFDWTVNYADSTYVPTRKQHGII